MIDHRSYALHDGGTTRRDFIVGFRIGDLAFRVVGLGADFPLEILTLSPDSVLRIWPCDGEAKRWPPRLAHDDEAFASFMTVHSLTV